MARVTHTSRQTTIRDTDRARLFFRDGTSDKVYEAEVVAKGRGYVVNYAFGRRGAKLTRGTKTPKPVDRDKARALFEKLVGEKIAKGYRHERPRVAAAPRPRASATPRAAGDSAAVTKNLKPLRASDFTERRGHGRSNWLPRRRLETAIGPFELDLETWPKEPPDERMIALMERLRAYAAAHAQAILEIVFAEYQRVRKTDPEWLEGQNVPLDLTRETVMRYVGDGSLTVSRDDDEGPLDAYIYFRPRWDEEHCLYLRFDGRRIMNVNDSPFTLKNGQIKYRWG